jgi:hypothetical protein
MTFSEFPNDGDLGKVPVFSGDSISRFALGEDGRPAYGDFGGDRDIVIPEMFSAVLLRWQRMHPWR